MMTNDDRFVDVPRSDRVFPQGGDADDPPLIMHVVYRFSIGGLENGIVNLIERLPPTEFRHVIVALTECVPQFCRRVTRSDVEFLSLHKPPGHGWQVYRPIWKLFRQHRPTIVHTRNLAALEMQLPAWAAGVPIRLHGEHGRDALDPHGKSRRFRLVRRAFSPFVTHYVAVSADLMQYLIDGVGIGAGRVTYICNGVDEQRFAEPDDQGAASAAVSADDRPVVGTVGRLEKVKNQPLLIAAIARLIEQDPDRRRQFRVRIVGDGPMRAVLERDIAERGLGDIIELCGERDDISVLMRAFDVFVLPSLAEGISNTVLEAMATGLPVVATAVGGNTDLVTAGKTGLLVPASDVAAMARAIATYLDSPDLRREHGAHARADVEARFTLSGMVEQYRALYRRTLGGHSRSRSPI